eukprot:Nk52_evm28s229 gene=Nk52_evmTU28s229
MAVEDETPVEGSQSAVELSPEPPGENSAESEAPIETQEKGPSPVGSEPPEGAPQESPGKSGEENAEEEKSSEEQGVEGEGSNEDGEAEEEGAEDDGGVDEDGMAGDEGTVGDGEGEAVGECGEGEEPLQNDGSFKPRIRRASLAEFELEDPIIDPETFPESYKSNSQQEELILGYVEVFRRQYAELFPDRKPLILCPPNEFGVSKFISSYIRPSLPPFKELYDHTTCAKFVSDYLNYQILSDPTNAPTSLNSPTTTLLKQNANCFEYSNLLCSFLIRAGYDAYAVSGYASLELTLMDQSNNKCPFLDQEEKVIEREKEQTRSKYVVRPPRSLTSKFEEKYKARLIAEEEKAKRKLLEEQKAKEEKQRLGDDDLKGLRVHSWVVLNAGKREVPSTVFIEPTRGICFPPDHEAYLGIESVWNHENYWVNMQDCSGGLGDITFDLSDTSRWEYVLPSEGSSSLVYDDENAGDQSPRSHSPSQEDPDAEKIIELPPSWVSSLEISQEQYETRCPNGTKTTVYREAQYEQFADYLREDGMVSRLKLFKRDPVVAAKENDKHNIKEIIEQFSHRKDKLHKRVRNPFTGQITEFFLPGRIHALKKHIYFVDPDVENHADDINPKLRILEFYPHARLDGLKLRSDDGIKLREHFQGREDNLVYRSCRFKTLEEMEEESYLPPSKTGNEFGLDLEEEEEVDGITKRAIKKLAQKFTKPETISGKDAIKKRTFLVDSDRIRLQYHLGPERVSALTRGFFHAHDNDPKKVHHEVSGNFSPEGLDTTMKSRHVSLELQSLISMQTDVTMEFRQAEAETREILEMRDREEISTALAVSFHDTIRNNSAKVYRDEMKTKKSEEDAADEEIDYLAPLLVRLTDPTNLTHEDAIMIREECLRDLKQKLIDRANLIQSRLEEETSELQQKQAWYTTASNISKEEEQEFAAASNECMFKIHILEQRLNKHKEEAQQKYMELDQQLRTDPRLRDLF